MAIKKGDIVGRLSCGKDIFFIVDNILTIGLNKQIAVLKGINIRVMADSPISDLEVISKSDILKNTIYNDKKINEMIKKNYRNRKQTRYITYTGKILHLDGDRRYTEKSISFYSKMGLNFIVKNIAEYRQAKVVIPLLNKYNPDILIITGHDAMLKKGSNYNNIYNYRNSRPFYKHRKGGKKMGKKFRQTSYLCTVHAKAFMKE